MTEAHHQAHHINYGYLLPRAVWFCLYVCTYLFSNDGWSVHNPPPSGRPLCHCRSQKICMSISRAGLAGHKTKTWIDRLSGRQRKQGKAKSTVGTSEGFFFVFFFLLIAQSTASNFCPSLPFRDVRISKLGRLIHTYLGMNAHAQFCLQTT